MTITPQQFYYPIPQMMQNEASSAQGLGDFIGCLRRRRKLIVFFTLMAFVLGSLFTLTTSRQYEAHAGLLVQLGENRGDQGGYSLAQASQDSVVLSTIEMLRSPDIADAVIKDQKLGYGIKRFLDHLSVKPVGRSLLIDVSYRDRDATQSAAIVNRLVTLYQTKLQDEKGIEAKKSSQWLLTQLGLLSEQVKKSSRAVEDYRSGHGLFGDDQNDVTGEQISDISSQLIAAQADAAAAQAQQTQLQNLLDQKKSGDNTTMVLNGHMVAVLKQDETDLLSQQAQLQSKYGPNHPRMKALQAQLGEVRAKKEQEIQRMVQSVSNDSSTAKAKVNALQNGLNDLIKKRQDENNASVGLHELERQSQADRTIYEDFLTRYKDLTLTSNLAQPGVKLISAARVPTSPAGASWIIILGLFALFGFIFGILAALLLEQLENHIRTPEQLRLIAPSLDVLAMIPQSNDMTADETFIESIRSLRIALSNNDATNVIAVTSALAGEGKSTTSLWLARVMAASGAKVLLIDGDLRHAGLQKSVALNPFYSVADILLKRAAFKDVMTKDKQIANLSLLVGKTTEPSDIDLLMRDKIADFLTQVATQYDVVIVDTPPSILASEAIWWLQEADRCLYLTRWDHTPFDVVKSEIKRLKSSDVTIDGFVITRVDAREHAAYGYHDTLHHYLRHHAAQKIKLAA